MYKTAIFIILFIILTGCSIDNDINYDVEHKDDTPLDKKPNMSAEEFIEELIEMEQILGISQRGLN